MTKQHCSFKNSEKERTQALSKEVLRSSVLSRQSVTKNNPFLNLKGDKKYDSFY